MDTNVVVVVVLVALVCLLAIRALSAGASRRARDTARTDLSPRPAPVTPGDLPPGVREALQRGQKIEAIRLYREATGVGLREAKERVETAERLPR